MFKIKKERFGELDCVIITNKKYGIETQIINGFGAIVNKLIVNHSPFSFISGYHCYDDLIQSNCYFSRSAKLFPFPNRLKNGQYQYKSNCYQLEANFPWSEHAVHGLLYNQPFELIESKASTSFAEITLRFETQCLSAGYPFAFKLDIKFHINSQGVLSCRTTIINIGTKTMPFGDAWHPYFSLGTSRDECQLQMPACHEIEHVDDLPTDNRHPYHLFCNSTSLSGHQLNHCFEFKPDSPVNLSLNRNDNNASLHIRLDAGYRFVQLYTPDSEQSIAIEPMTCPADAFNNHIGLLYLEPNQEQSFHWQCQAIYLDSALPE